VISKVLLADLSGETEEVIGNTTVIKLDSRSQTGTSPPVFHQRKTGNQSGLTIGIFIKAPFDRKHVHEIERLAKGGGMTAALIHSSSQSKS